MMRNKAGLPVVLFLLTVVYLFIAIGISSYATPGRVRSDHVYARTYGDKTFAAFTNCLALIGSNTARGVVIDGGVWNITTNVHVPSNITLIFAEDSYFTISTSVLMNLPGVKIMAPNRLLFDGQGNATGPIGNVFSEPLWQGSESFYLAPLHTGLVTTATYTNDLAGLSNGMVRFATNSDVSISNSLVTFATNSDVSVSNSIVTYVQEQTNLIGLNFVVSNNPVQLDSLSYTTMPFIGSVLAIGSATPCVYPQTFSVTDYTGRGWVKMTNWSVLSDPLGYWDADSNAFRPTRPGRWNVGCTIAVTAWENDSIANNPDRYVEIVFVKNASSNAFGPGTALQYTNAGQSVFLDEASGNTNFGGTNVINAAAPRGIASGTFNFGVTNGQSTTDCYEIFWGSSYGTCRVNSATLYFDYRGQTELTK